MQEENGRSKGCGLVEFSSAHEARRAIEQLNDSNLKGRSIFVREDRETTVARQYNNIIVNSNNNFNNGYANNNNFNNGYVMNNNNSNFNNGYVMNNGRTISLDQELPATRAYAAGAGGGGGTKLYVGNLSFDTGWQQLKDHFRNAQAGEIIRVDVMTHNDSGRSKGFAVVEYSNEIEASTAIERLNNSSLDGRPLNVRIYRDN